MGFGKYKKVEKKHWFWVTIKRVSSLSSQLPLPLFPPLCGATHDVASANIPQFQPLNVLKPTDSLGQLVPRLHEFAMDKS
jgi:hypothetical protein